MRSRPAGSTRICGAPGPGQACLAADCRPSWAESQREQSHRSALHESDGVEVVLTAAQTPVQARLDGAPRVPRLEPPELVAGRDLGAERHGGGHRFVGRPELALGHDDDTATGQPAGVGDDAASRSEDRCTRRPGQVGTPVTAAVAGRRRREAPADRHRLIEGPPPLVCGGDTGSRAGTCTCTCTCTGVDTHARVGPGREDEGQAGEQRQRRQDGAHPDPRSRNGIVLCSVHRGPPSGDGVSVGVRSLGRRCGGSKGPCRICGEGPCRRVGAEAGGPGAYSGVPDGGRTCGRRGRGRAGQHAATLADSTPYTRRSDPVRRVDFACPPPVPTMAGLVHGLPPRWGSGPARGTRARPPSGGRHNRPPCGRPA